LFDEYAKDIEGLAVRLMEMIRGHISREMLRKNMETT
jgi:hypothetical protein